MSPISDATIPVVSCSTRFQKSRFDALRKCLSLPYLSSLVWNSFTRASFSVYNFRKNLSSEEYEQLLKFEKRKRSLSWSLSRATNLHEWLRLAGELDDLDGNNEWKAIDESDEYDHKALRTRLDDLEEALGRNDFAAILHNIRTSFARDLSNMTNPELYKCARIGTKNLIDLYVTTATTAVSTVLDLADKLFFNIDETRYLLEQLQATRQAFGRSALLLSGGATFGMNHTGVVKSLWQMRLLPRVISGSSSGSIVAGVVCAHTDEEIPAILSSFGSGDFSVFGSDDQPENLMHRIKRFLTTGSLFDINHLRRVMRDLIGDITFLEAYYRTRRILNITVSHAEPHELPRLLNYVTSPNVVIWSAIATSCSVPLVFSASALMAKDPATGIIEEWGESLVQWIDGSVDSDLPMARLSEMFNVNHFIVSQVNPHVIPFVPPEEAFLLAELSKRQPPNETGGTSMPKELLKAEIMSKFSMISELGVFSNALRKMASIMRQEYYGEINVLPEITYEVFPSLLKNPTHNFMLRACLSGERATWPKLGRIRNHCAVELALDAAVLIMREKAAAAAKNANIPLNTNVSSYFDENIYADDTATTKPHRRRLSKNEKAKAVRVHMNSAHQLRRSRSSLLIPEPRHVFHAHHVQGPEAKARPSRQALTITRRVTEEINVLHPVDLDMDGTADLPAPMWFGLGSLFEPHQHSQHRQYQQQQQQQHRHRQHQRQRAVPPTRSGRHTPVSLSRRGSFVQFQALPCQHPPPTVPPVRQLNNYQASLPGVTFPRFVMAAKSGPPSPPVPDYDYPKCFRMGSNDAIETSSRYKRILNY